MDVSALTNSFQFSVTVCKCEFTAKFAATAGIGWENFIIPKPLLMSHNEINVKVTLGSTGFKGKAQFVQNTT